MTRKAAIIGGGVIGGGWAARFLLNGRNVSFSFIGNLGVRVVAPVEVWAKLKLEKHAPVGR